MNEQQSTLIEGTYETETITCRILPNKKIPKEWIEQMELYLKTYKNATVAEILVNNKIIAQIKRKR